MRELALASLELENGPQMGHVYKALWQVYGVLLWEMSPKNGHLFLKKVRMF